MQPASQPARLHEVLCMYTCKAYYIQYRVQYDTPPSGCDCGIWRLGTLKLLALGPRQGLSLREAGIITSQGSAPRRMASYRMVWLRFASHRIIAGTDCLVRRPGVSIILDRQHKAEMCRQEHRPTPKPDRFTTLQRRVSPHTSDSTDSKPQEASAAPAWRSTLHNASHDTSTSLQPAAPGPGGARTGSGVQRLELHVFLLARLWLLLLPSLGWPLASGKTPGIYSGPCSFPQMDLTFGHVLEPS